MVGRFSSEDRMFDDRPDFNMAVMFLTRLDILSGLVDDCIRDGDLIGAYRLLKRIYYRIEYKVVENNDKELFDDKYEVYRESIEKGFQKVGALLKGDKKLASMNQHQVDLILDDINRCLFRLLWDLHMIFPEKFKISWQDEVKGDFE